jgi:hypothetical protein
MKPKMYATCLDDRARYLEKGKEYRIVRVAVYKRFGEHIFYILENGLAYSGCHFSVTYLLNRE